MMDCQISKVLWAESTHKYKLHFIRGQSTRLPEINKRHQHPILKQNKDKAIATQSNEIDI